MFLPSSEPPTTGLRALAGLALDFALLRDGRSDWREPRERAGAVHPHRRVFKRRCRHRGGAVAPRPQVCVCARTSDHDAL